MISDPIEILERIAETGTAPEEGCSLFGVGYEAAFARLKDVYIDRAFSSGRSAEKFVVGPYGSGKTHFLRQLMEIGREAGCATSEVALNQDIDFTKTLLVYQEVAREIRAPGQISRGIRELLEYCLKKVRASKPDDAAVASWVAGVGRADFKDSTFARIAGQALQAILDGNTERADTTCRWLGGEVADRSLSREVGASVITKSEQNRFGLCALLSMCQLIRHSGFQGTVICLDEAEQGFSVGKREFDRVLSMLQSGINATKDLPRGSALIVFAITPDIAEGMEGFPALQGRVADPARDQGFFDGNSRASKIELERRGDPVEELQQIGGRLVDLLYGSSYLKPAYDRDEVLARVTQEAREIAESDAAVSNRRTMAKRTASILVNLHETGSLDFAPPDPAPPRAEQGA